VQQQATNLSAAEITHHIVGAAPTCHVYGDTTQLEQVMVNLIDNAIRAMTTTHTPRLLEIVLRGDERTVEIRVSDTGTGIPPHIRSRLFEPFFTTRPIGDGLGLGLAIVSTIVAQHHGSIRAEEHTPSGTTFILTLPSIHAPRLVVARQTLASDTYLTILDVLRELVTTPIVESDDPHGHADLVVIDASQLAAFPQSRLADTRLCIIRTIHTSIPDLTHLDAIVCTPQMDVVLLRQQLSALIAPLQSR
jgi:anti-sigma regulatory factor (Ser/Thr protein kinase)